MEPQKPKKLTPSQLFITGLKLHWRMNKHLSNSQPSLAQRKLSEPLIEKRK